MLFKTANPSTRPRRPSENPSPSHGGKPRQRRTKTQTGIGPVPPGYTAPSRETPSVGIRPPSTHREVLLPLVDIGSRKFEELCRDLVATAFPDLVKRTSLKRTGGVEQFGVDVEGFDEEGEPAVVLSAKCYQKINAWDFRLWIDEFARHLDGHWNGKRVRDFILAISHEANDDAMNDAARLLTAELRRRDIRFHLWNTDTISRHLRHDPCLVDRYFHRYWVEAISASTDVPAPAAPRPVALTPEAGSPRASGILLQAFAQAERQMNDRVDAAMGATLETAITAVGAGRPGELVRWFEHARSDPGLWEGLTPVVRARAARGIAMLRLRDGEIGHAGELLDEADALSPPTDASSRALLLRATISVDDALVLLRNPLVPRERETKAAILIEADRVPEAVSALAEAVGAEVTAETLRLRSIAALLQGRIDDALADARSAVERAHDQLAPLLNLATVRLYSALSSGVRPQVGYPPEPIHPGVVRDGRTALANLSAAADDFDRALRMAEEGLKPDIEIWKLAALILNPTRSEEAASFATELLARPLPQPLAVVWALSHRVVDRPGRLKRAYGNAIREGLATPSHLVVLALMSAGNDHPKRGSALIRRYADRFPTALDFLERWRMRFGVGEAGDVSFPEAKNRALRDGDNGQLVDLAIAAGTDAETVLSVAEFLLWRKAWSDLHRLRMPLMAIATPRATELAAIGALQAGDPTGCLSVLEEGARTFEGARLPRSLVHHRIAANEELGRHGRVIVDLLELRRDGGDPYAHARVMDALVRIGDLDGLRKEAERALDQNELDPRHALNVAYALRANAPAIARRALMFAVRDAPPAEATGAIVALAAELGLPDLREEMLRVLLSNPAAGRIITRIDSVEDAVALFERMSQDHRERFGEWLGGRLPFALATASDLGTFGRMFLAEPAQRRDNLGQPFPMLLLSGSQRNAVTMPADGELRLDLSALLLASRLGLLTDLERAFPLRVPLGAAEALIELEACYRAPNAEIIAGVQEVLDGRGIHIGANVPEGAVTADDSEDPTEIAGAVANALVERAFMAGHLDRDHADRTLSVLGAADAAACDVSRGVVLGRLSVTRLAGVGVLSQVTRATPMYLSVEDREQLRRDVVDAVEDGRLRQHVAGLRTLLADRLHENRWTTFARRAAEARQGHDVPVHLRCLLEAVSAQEHDPGPLWIEDRALSHGRQPGFLHLPNVLDLLLEGGFIDVPRRSHLLREARRIGYAYLPLDPDAYHSALEAAPINDGVVVETPALAQLRVGMARDIELLTHLDLVGEVPDHGPVVGEGRRLLDAWGLTRELLARLWKQEASPEDRRARSDWVWTNLRIDRLIGLPADSTPEARRHFKALHLAHLLDLPLLAKLDGETTVHGRWREFVEWLMATCGRPLTENDPQVKDTVIAILSGQLAKILERPDDLPLEHAHGVGLALAKLVQGYLDVLPDDWSNALSSAPAVGERLDLRSALVLTIGAADDEAGVIGQVALHDVAAAYACASSMQGPVRRQAAVRLIDGRTVRIELGDIGDDTRATIVVADHRASLDTLTLALLEPNAEARSIPDDHRRRLLDPHGTITVDALAEVEHTDGLDARFMLLNDLVDGDLHHRLLRMTEKVMAKSVLGIADFVLPRPETIAAFLRIPLTADPNDLAAAACEALSDAMDPEEAARRLAGLPFELPAGYLRQRGEELVRRGGLVGEHDASPLFALLDLRALTAAEATGPMIDAAVEALENAMTLRGAFFVALLRYSAAAATRDNAWRALDPAKGLAFLWSFADQCVQRLSYPKADFRPIAPWLEERTSFPLVDRTSDSAAPAWYIYQTIGLSEARFAGALVGQAVRSGAGAAGSKQAFETLATCCGSASSSGWMPDLELVSPPPMGPLTLWAASDPLAPDAMGIWIHPENPFAHRTDDAIARGLLDAHSDMNAQPFIAPLLSIVDTRRLETDTKVRMLRVIEGPPGTEAFEPNSGGTRRVMSVEARLRAMAKDEAGMHAALVREGRRCAARWPSATLRAGSAENGALMLLVETAFEFALALSSPMPDRFDSFGRCVEEIVHAWPDSARAAIAKLDAAVRLVDAEAGGSLWPSLLRLRASGGTP